MNTDTEPQDTHLRHLDLFSGAGLFALAARWSGIETVAFSEIEPYANRVLAARFPETRNLGDIRRLVVRTPDVGADDPNAAENLDGGGDVWCSLCNEWFGACECIGADEFTDTWGFPEIVTAGFPCQDVSYNSHTGTGIGGARSGLVSNALRIARELQPAFLLLENVAALKTRGADQLLAGLEEDGYACEPFVVGAHHVGGEHQRKRAWIVAYHPAQRIQGVRPEGEQEPHTLAGPLLPLRRGDGQWEVEPDFRRAPDGDPNRLDRLAVIGNGIVPQIPVHFYDLMREVMRAPRWQPPVTD